MFSGIEITIANFLFKCQRPIYTRKADVRVQYGSYSIQKIPWVPECPGVLGRSVLKEWPNNVGWTYMSMSRVLHHSRGWLELIGDGPRYRWANAGERYQLNKMKPKSEGNSVYCHYHKQANYWYPATPCPLSPLLEHNKASPFHRKHTCHRAISLWDYESQELLFFVLPRSALIWWQHKWQNNSVVTGAPQGDILVNGPICLLSFSIPSNA